MVSMDMNSRSDEPRIHDRFTHRSRHGRGNIPRFIRHYVYERDEYRCQYCRSMFKADALTIDHLIPLSLGGLDEPINYVTCCVQCNQSKSNLPLDRFARTINIPVEKLPVHGDPVIDNERLPIQIRLIFLLVELAKSAKTRNLIGSVLTPDCDISARLASVQSKTPDESLRKKIEWARARFERNIERWDFEHTRNMMKLQSSKQATQS